MSDWVDFKTDLLRQQFQGQLNAETREVVERFGAFSKEESLPKAVVTCVFREPVENSSIYYYFYKRLQAAVVKGDRYGMITEKDGRWRPLSESEWALEREIHMATDDQLRERAAQKASYHMLNLAVDLRSKHYSTTSKLRKTGALQDSIISDFGVALWFFESKEKLPKQTEMVDDRLTQKWEFLVHDITAPHIHVARHNQAALATLRLQLQGKLARG